VKPTREDLRWTRVRQSIFQFVPVSSAVGSSHHERLEAVPDANRCVSCQRHAESAAATPNVSDVNCPLCAKQGPHFAFGLGGRPATQPSSLDISSVVVDSQSAGT